MRQWKIGAKLWRARKQRIEKVHEWRPRRSRFGELVQWDTSDHDWLEGRGEEILLINMIDDATSRWFARFVSSDSTVENMNHLERYLKKHGRPLAYYTDKAAIFQTAEKTKRDGSRLGKSREELPPTQIGRALHARLLGRRLIESEPLRAARVALEDLGAEAAGGASARRAFDALILRFVRRLRARTAIRVR